MIERAVSCIGPSGRTDQKIDCPWGRRVALSSLPIARPLAGVSRATLEPNPSRRGRGLRRLGDRCQVSRSDQGGYWTTVRRRRSVW
jgi:hypothetical protein